MDEQTNLEIAAEALVSNCKNPKELEALREWMGFSLMEDTPGVVRLHLKYGVNWDKVHKLVKRVVEDYATPKDKLLVELKKLLEPAPSSSRE